MLVHVDMVKDSGGLVAGVSGVLKAVEADDRVAGNDAYQQAVAALRKINNTMDGALSPSLIPVPSPLPPIIKHNMLPLAILAGV